VVTGGPGTGKTTTIARLLGVLTAVTDEPLRTGLAAPTGKAAARLTQVLAQAIDDTDFPAAQRGQLTGLSASTIHRLLGSRPDSRTRFRHHRGNPLPHDVVIVDETSMVSLTLMARLIEAVRPSARLILLGDVDQLASVDAGAVLKDIVEGLSALGDPAVIRLEAIHRFGEVIGRLASAIRTGDADAALDLLQEGQPEARLVGSADIRHLVMPPSVALYRAADAGLREEAVHALDAHRLLCAHREGPYGVRHWNGQLERWLMAETARQWLPPWYAGQPVIANANDYGLGLFNGDSGVVCRDDTSPTGLVALISDGEHPAGRPYPLTRLADVSTAHAVTVHRSQGSQFDQVTVLLPEPESPLLTRELLYTAVTRARSTVRVVGSEESVRAAIDRRAQRATGMAHRLGQE